MRITLSEKKLFLLAVTILLILYRSQYCLARGIQPDLYTDDDDVLRLNQANFNVIFKEGLNVTFMVQFYNTFCGHCQMFAPIYKEFATRVKNWSSLIEIAGIDCSKNENLATCASQDIQAFPTILFYPPNTKPKNSNDKPISYRDLTYEWNVDGLEEASIDYLYNLTASNRVYPHVLKALIPIEEETRFDLKRINTEKDNRFDEVVNESSYPDLMIIVEGNKSYLGRKLILEYSRIINTVEIRRVTHTNTPFIKSIISTDDFQKIEDISPILVQITGDSTKFEQFILVRGEAKNALPSGQRYEREDYIYNKFKRFFEHHYSIELQESYHSIKPTNKFIENADSIMYGDDLDDDNKELALELIASGTLGEDRVFAQDILKGISYMITHEVIARGNLTLDEYDTVQDILTVLRKFAPLNAWDPKLFEMITDLRKRFAERRAIIGLGPVSGQSIQDMVQHSGGDEIRSKYSNKDWISCSESDKSHKGYTCSLWLIFHMLTVGEYQKSSPVRVRPNHVLLTMRDYITRFLGCSVCGDNFKKETKNMRESLTQRNSSVLWLWETHNKVNERLNNEKTTARRTLADVIYPSRKICPNCYPADSEHNIIQLDGLSWNHTEVLSYLIHKYGSENIISPKRLRDFRKLRLNDISTTNQSAEQWNILTTSDMSLEIFLYLLSIIIVAIVCTSLNPRWRRSKTK